MKTKTTTIALNLLIVAGAFCLPTHSTIGHFMDFVLVAEMAVLGTFLVQRIAARR